ncbi:MAG: PAS domain S-box protein, partial [Candidatus Caldatribacteriaceae bacterium]
MTSGEWGKAPGRVFHLHGREIWLLDLAGNLLDAVENSPLFSQELERHREGEWFDMALPLRGTVRVKLLRLGERLFAVLSRGAFDFPFTTFIENDPEDIFYRIRLSPERYFEYVSPSVTRITGYTPEEHYLDPDLGWKIVHPGDRELLADVIQKKWFGKPVVLRFIRKDGEVIFTEQVNVPVYDEAGNLVALEGIVRDVTERKRLEEEFRQKAREFEWLLEHMISAFVVHEAVFDDEGRFVDFRILYVNRAYEDVVGVKREEILGRTARELWPGMEEEWFLHHERVVRTGIPQVFELYHTPTRRLYRCRAYNPWGKGNRYCVVFDDVTEQKLALKREEYVRRMLLAICNVNQLITQEEDPHRLIEGACQKLTETMGIFSAWIVRLEGEAVVDLAASGEGLPGTLPEALGKGDWPSCLYKALQENAVWITDPRKECSECFLKERYEGRSGLALSLSFAGETYGVLVMSLPREFLADREVLGLLQEVAQDLGFALYKIKMRQKL